MKFKSLLVLPFLVTSLKAASIADLNFTLINGGTEYSVSDCDQSASGSLDIPSTYNDLPVTSIGEDAFNGCTSLNNITIPNNVSSIGGGAFADCTSLASITIPDSVTLIWDYAFIGCTSLASITIPDSVILIGSSAFYDCSSLNNITIPNSVTSIENDAFAYCSSLSNITIPDGVTFIGDGAFAYCSSLTSITIPDSVTSIGYAAFYNCTSLTNITIPYNVSSLGGEAFRQCRSLAGIVIPDNVTSIEIATFYDCSSLTNLILGENVNTIGFKAFNGCSSLTSVNIPENLTSIHPSAFYKCSKLNEITVSPNNNSYTSIDNSLYNKTITTLVRSRSDVTEISLPNTVTAIGGDAYGGCLGLISITIPDIITTVGKYAFGYCSNLESVNYGSQTSIEPGVFEHCISLSSFNISDSVTSISSDAFESCISLNSITIPDSVTFIGGNAFLNCSDLNYIRCEATTAPTIGPDWWTGSEAGPFVGVAVQSISVPLGSAQSYLDAGDGSTYGGLTVLTDPDSDNDGIGDSADEFPNTPTQDVINAIKSNPLRYSLYSTSDIQDLRAGSTMIEIQDGQATLSMEVEESNDLGIWTTGGASTLQIPIDAEAGKKFFRFKMTE